MLAIFICTSNFGKFLNLSWVSRSLGALVNFEVNYHIFLPPPPDGKIPKFCGLSLILITMMDSSSFWFMIILHWTSSDCGPLSRYDKNVEDVHRTTGLSTDIYTGPMGWGRICRDIIRRPKLRVVYIKITAFNRLIR